jgi:hypothetical protein
MKRAEFRQELMKIMPGYKWTLEQSSPRGVFSATGIQTSGFNRLSTLSVIRREKDDRCIYVATSSGYGARADWVGECDGMTLARALRALQEHYERKASLYGGLAANLQTGRRPATGEVEISRAARDEA